LILKLVKAKLKNTSFFLEQKGCKITKVLKNKSQNGNFARLLFCCHRLRTLNTVEMYAKEAKLEKGLSFSILIYFLRLFI